MVNLMPFCALRPQPNMTDEVAAPPYDVMNRSEARDMIVGKTNSILRVTRPDAVLADSISIDEQEAYDFAQQELKRLIDEAVLIYDETPAFYIYTQQMGQHRQNGIVGLASADDYWQDRIKKHEFTLPRKENDRMKQVLSLGAHLGPVFLTHQAHPTLAEIIKTQQNRAPDVHHIAPDGISHELWIVNQDTEIESIQKSFSELDALYIADGHHRAAAAARVSQELGENASASHFLSVSFAEQELLVLPYHRVVTELSMSSEDLIKALEENFDLEESAAPVDLDPSAPVAFPPQAQTWGMYLEQTWYLMRAKASLNTLNQGKALTAQLDVSVLQDHILAPLLAVSDPRTCEHIQFVGGIRGFRALEQMADQSKGVAFALYPTSVQELIGIADSGSVMPPKSTWFEPKLRTGLMINVFDQSKLS